VDFPCSFGSTDAAVEMCHTGETYCSVAVGGGGTSGANPAHCVPFSTTPACPTVENSCACTPASFAFSGCTCQSSPYPEIWVTCEGA
jgi:hypothetical protein